jgi:hypothetical protein
MVIHNRFGKDCEIRWDKRQVLGTTFMAPENSLSLTSEFSSTSIIARSFRKHQAVTSELRGDVLVCGNTSRRSSNEKTQPNIQKPVPW